MDAEDGCFFTIIIVVLVVAVGIGIGCLVNNSWRREAVAQGKAEFYLDEKNERQWRWKPELIGPPLPPEKL